MYWTIGKTPGEVNGGATTAERAASRERRAGPPSDPAAGQARLASACAEGWAAEKASSSMQRSNLRISRG